MNEDKKTTMEAQILSTTQDLQKLMLTLLNQNQTLNKNIKSVENLENDHFKELKAENEKLLIENSSLKAALVNLNNAFNHTNKQLDHFKNEVLLTKKDLNKLKESVILSKDNQGNGRKAITQEKQQQIINLHLQNYSHSQISKMVGVSETTVQKYISQYRQ